MRPKSMATVVVPFCGVAARLSTPSLALVTSASVRSGTISETAPTSVVLPTPNPPAITILVEVTRLRGSDFAKSTEDPFDEFTTFGVGRVFLQGGQDLKMTGLDQVGDEDACHSEGHTHPGGDLGDRRRLLAQRDDGRVDVVEFPLPVHRLRQCLNQRFERE